MILVKAKRTIKAGLVSFWRNGLISFAAVLVMVLALFMIGSLIFSNVLLTSTLRSVEEKVDVSVYFKVDAQEQEILLLQDSLEEFSEVAEVDYVSRDNSLAIFKDRHRENALIANSLSELDDNPFGAVLNVRAKTPSQYESIALFLEEGDFSIIDKINYRKNKIVIDRLASIIRASEKVGIGIAGVLSVIAMLIVFNTIRLAIYSFKEEIGIMKLVGASRRYVRTPFLIEGTLYGALASFITMLIFWPLTAWLGPLAETFFGGLNLYSYYIANLTEFFLILFGTGVTFGITSSYIATRRYLKV